MLLNYHLRCPFMFILSDILEIYEFKYLLTVVYILIYGLGF